MLDLRSRENLNSVSTKPAAAQTFNLADRVKVLAATIENGLLSIELVREVPEALKPRRIEIGAPSPTISGQDNQGKLSDQNSDRQVQAA